jgi:hypothetical protein
VKKIEGFHLDVNSTIQGGAKLTWHSTFHNKRAVPSAFCAILYTVHIARSYSHTVLHGYTPTTLTCPVSTELTGLDVHREIWSSHSL